MPIVDVQLQLAEAEVEVERRRHKRDMWLIDQIAKGRKLKAIAADLGKTPEWTGKLARKAKARLLLIVN